MNIWTEYRGGLAAEVGTTQVRVVYCRGGWAGKYAVTIYRKKRGKWVRQRTPREHVGPFPLAHDALEWASLYLGVEVPEYVFRRGDRLGLP